MNPRLNLNWSRRRRRGGGFMLNRLSKDYQICNSNLLCPIYSCHFFLVWIQDCLYLNLTLEKTWQIILKFIFSVISYTHNKCRLPALSFSLISFLDLPTNFGPFWFFAIGILLFSRCRDYERVFLKIKTLITTKNINRSSFFYNI